MSNIQRIAPESKTAMIQFIEENFHDIESFVMTFSLKTGEVITYYDVEDYMDAAALAGVTQNNIHYEANEGHLITRKMLREE